MRDAMMCIVDPAIAAQGRFADSESRVLATKIFSCLTAQALVSACGSRRFARIAWRRFGRRIAVGRDGVCRRGCARASQREPEARWRSVSVTSFERV